jgi:hypothetical protein
LTEISLWAAVLRLQGVECSTSKFFIRMAEETFSCNP